MAKEASFQGQEPKASPIARALSVLLGLLLLALAGVLIREIWFVLPNDDQQSWITPITEFFGQDELPEWIVWVGVGSIVVGLLLLIVTFKPRPRTSRGKQHCRNLDAPSRHCAHQLGYGTTVTRSSVGSLEDIEKEASRRY